MRHKSRNHPTGPVMRIGGEVVSIAVAKILYRCAACLSPLKYQNNGLACTTDPTHRGFIHRNQGATQADQISKNLAEIEEQIWKTH